MNFGGFASGFAQGFDNGTRIGKNVGDLVKQDRIEKLRAKGMEEAQAASDAAANKMIVDGGITGQKQDAPKVAGAAAPAAPAADAGSPDVKTSPVDVPTSQSMSAAPAPTAATAPATPTAAPPVDASLAGSPEAQAQTPATTGTVPADTAPAPETVSPASTNPASVAAGGLTGTPAPSAPMKRYRVGDASFDTREEALAHAKKRAPTAADLFIQNAVPKISEAYLAQGDVEKAEAWDKYAKDKQNQRYMATWAKAYQAAQSGDWQSAADHVAELHNQTDDGVSIVGKPETVKDKAGNVTGFNVRFKNDATGEERDQFVDPQGLMQMGIAGLNPQKQFELGWQREQTAAAERAKAALEAQKEGAAFKRQVTIEGMKEDRADKRAAAAQDREDKRNQARADADLNKLQVEYGLKSQQHAAELKAGQQALKDAGYTDAEIKAMTPGLLKVGEFKKSTSPEERSAMIATELAKDPLFMRKSPEDKAKAVREVMQAGAAGAQPAGSSAAPKQTVPNPTAPGAPAPQYFRDPANGDIVTFQNGVRTVVKKGGASAPGAPAAEPESSKKTPPAASKTTTSSPAPANPAAAGLPGAGRFDPRDAGKALAASAAAEQQASAQQQLGAARQALADAQARYAKAKSSGLLSNPAVRGQVEGDLKAAQANLATLTARAG